jgi:magnesium transporter
MITYYFRTVKDSALKQISDLRSGVWIHAELPSDEELQDLFAKLNLDENLIEDVQDFYEVPRTERSDNARYFFTRYPYADKKEDIETAPLTIVMGKTFVLTVVHRPIPQFDQFFKGKTVIHTTQKTKFFLHMVETITDSYERQLVTLRRSVHKDRAKLRKIGSKEIEQFVNYEHKLNDMISALVPTNTALQQVTKSKTGVVQLYEEDMELMEDILIDNNQLVDSARTVLRTIQNVRSATEAILASTLNATIRTLTLVTVLLTIPMVVASLYGMNVMLPLANENWAFWGILGGVSVLVGLAMVVFKRNGWL